MVSAEKAVFQRNQTQRQRLSTKLIFRILAIVSGVGFLLLVLLSAGESGEEGAGGEEQRQSRRQRASFVRTSDMKNGHSSASATPRNATANKDVQLLSRVADYVRSHGGFINDKVEIRDLGGGMAGIFANAPLEKQELLWHMPPHLMIRTQSENYCDAVRNLRKRLQKDPSRQTPYEQYLSTRTLAHHLVPVFWSTPGKELLDELLGNRWNTIVDKRGVAHWYRQCGGAKEFASVEDVDSSVVQAIVLIKVRTETEYFDLIPFHDVLNHKRGRGYNTEPQYMKMNGGYLVQSTRPIEAGEEIAFSYSECHECGYADTHALFIYYGFIEPLPQIWESRNGRISFTIDQNPRTGEYQVEFDETPDQEVLGLIDLELQRLQMFRTQLWSNRVQNVPKRELSQLRQYHQALGTALKQASISGRAMLGSAQTGWA